MGLGRGLGERQAVDGGGAGEQVVVPGMGVFRQLLPVLGGGDDGLEGAARSVTAWAKIWSAPSARQDRPVTPGARSARAARRAWSTMRAVGAGRLRWPEIAMRYMEIL